MNVVPLINRGTLRVEITYLKSATTYFSKKSASCGLAKYEILKKHLSFITQFALLSKLYLRVS